MQSVTSDKPNDSKAQTVKRVSVPVGQRLKDLVKLFGKRDKKLLYVDGQPRPGTAEKFNPFRLNSTAAAIQLGVEQAEVESRGAFGRSISSESALCIDEHCVLDLYLSACRNLPGFEMACKSLGKTPSPVFKAKKAVAPVPFDGSEPPLRFDTPLFDRLEIKPSALCSALGFGATGSGKSASLVRPLLNAMLAYRLDDGKTTSMLVIDPKVELLSSVQEVLGQQGELDRLVVMGQCAALNFFEENDGLSLTDRFEKVKSFYATSSVNGDDARWQMFAEQLIMSFLKDDQIFANLTGLPLLESVVALVSNDMQYLKRNQWVALRKLLLFGMGGSEALRFLCDVYDVLMFSVGITQVERPISRYVNLKAESETQWFYNSRGSLTIVDGLGSDDMEAIIDMSVRRGLERPDRTDMAELIDRGAVLVLQPRQTKTHDIIGKALKSLFFRTVMERKDMTRPIAYVVDEFQRYITCDDETGDHGFLDRCRAYRCNAVLASQSMSALLTAVGEGRNGSTAVDSLLTNLPTKACFRTTDLATVRTTQSFIPSDSRSDQHVLSYRPPSSLLTGEYYFAFGHEWGRARYQLPEVRVAA